MSKTKFGLRDTPRDDRDFNLGAYTSLPDLSELPESFELKPLRTENQGDTDFCSAYMSTGMSELQEGVELDPWWSFAVSKKISGGLDDWGQDIRSALKAHLKPYGAIEHTPVSITATEARDINNWNDNLFDEAKKHRKQSYFKVNGRGESFDIVKKAIWKYRDEKRAVGTGLIWSWNLNQAILEGTQDYGFGHAVYILGWEKEHMVIQNSYGDTGTGGGRHLVARETINHFVKRYGAWMFIDEDPNKIKSTFSWRFKNFLWNWKN